MFGEDLESIEPEEKFDESVAGRIKTKPRKQNASSSLPKKDYSEEAADYLKYMEEQEKVKKYLVMIMIAMDGLVDLGA